MSLELASLLFPDVTQTIADLRAQYPARPEGLHVTRFAPSPTGFLHIGGVYSSFVAERFVHQAGQKGVMILRIEDTDQKREMDGGIDIIMDGLKTFGITFDEGPLGAGHSDVGAYGPYIQSRRKDLYAVFVKELVAQGKAYPCWMSPEEIEQTRTMQQAAKKVPGIYGTYSVWRDADFAKQAEQVATGAPFVIRLRAPAQHGETITLRDEIKGETTTQANFIDHVVLKSTD
jgi:glutamyl/glutaminyl-tRNA synthetase